jgi:dTDP-4-dehydrorhamnose 3,5-epimerase
VLSESAEFQYKCSDFYSAADERGLPWDDPGLGIVWPLDEMVPVLSGRDTRWHPLADAAPEDLPEYRP